MKALIFTVIFNSPIMSATINTAINTIETKTNCEMKITSGYRSRLDNKRVGGAPDSFHLFDRARDIKPKDKTCISIKDLGKIACKITSTIVYSNHIHIDDRSKPICGKGKYKWQM